MNPRDFTRIVRDRGEPVEASPDHETVVAAVAEALENQRRALGVVQRSHLDDAIRERDEARALLIEEQHARHAAGTRVAQLEREIAEARAALGEGWFVDGVNLATAIERKTIALEMAGQPVRPPALALVAGERWYWRGVESEHAEGPFDSREAALESAREDRGVPADVIVGRCIEVDVTKYVSAEGLLAQHQRRAVLEGLLPGSPAAVAVVAGTLEAAEAEGRNVSTFTTRKP